MFFSLFLIFWCIVALKRCVSFCCRVNGCAVQVHISPAFGLPHMHPVDFPVLHRSFSFIFCFMQSVSSVYGQSQYPNSSSPSLPDCHTFVLRACVSVSALQDNVTLTIWRCVCVVVSRYGVDLHF